MTLAELHCHGQNKNGKETLRADQFGGYSKSGNPKGRRLYDVEKIVGLRRTGATFASDRPSYDTNDSAMSYVHCHV
ncbi:MAG: hypothetical protein M3R02_10020 [Chloroflexota bacterium]|nr:hypothetical protein [Chloroflexota bacterium]